jgi:proline iminopeptidase
MDVTVEYVEAAGAVFWTARQGKGPALVLCHGGPGMWDYLGPVAALLDDVVTVYRFDQRACGRSSGGPPYDVATAVADLDALRVHWGLDNWIVGGHSWGARLALAYCLAHPSRVRGLIYLSGTGIDPAWHAAYRANRAVRLGPAGQRRLAALQERFAKAGDAEIVAADRELRSFACALDVADQTRAHDLVQQIFVADCTVNHDVNRLLGVDARQTIETDAMREQLARLRVPTLIVHGEVDLRPVWIAHHLAGLISGARLQTMPNVGHFPWLEQPERFARIFRRFLSTL